MRQGCDLNAEPELITDDNERPAGINPDSSCVSDQSNERLPRWRSNDQFGTARPLGVTDGDERLSDRRYLDAVAAVAAAVGGLAPGQVAVVHDFAASSSRDCEVAHGSASRTSVSQQSRRVSTSSWWSTSWP